MSKIKLLLFSIASGLIMALSLACHWRIYNCYSYCFCATLMVEYEISKRQGKTGFAVFSYAYLSFFIFQLNYDLLDLPCIPLGGVYGSNL